LDTIAAIATPPGFGAIGIVRISGASAPHIAGAVLGQVPKPRAATLAYFRDLQGCVIDQGIALFFPRPESYTGEDMLEMQGHGGPVVLDLLLRRVLELGARPARPGEFSERAFLNGKLDLIQAEAVADLIESGTELAARLAGRTLAGEFSRRVQALVEDLIRLRSFLEAAIDFADEDLEWMPEAQVSAGLAALVAAVEGLIDSAHQGRLIREGLQLVIAGAPNAGKSSLLNALAGADVAIVTAIPGTTRDLLRQEIQIDGMPLHIVDTAGLRSAQDPIEQEGLRRARDQIGRADHILWVFDDREDPEHAGLALAALPPGVSLTLVRNKIDLTHTPPGRTETTAGVEIALSARLGTGIDALKRHLKGLCGLRESTEGQFLARRRHLDALRRARDCMISGTAAFAARRAPELVAEDLRQAQRALGEITGEFTTDDLLGRIFSTFCIGK